MRVFAISHSMVVPANRIFFEELGKRIQLKAIIPRNWIQKNLSQKPKNFQLIEGTVLFQPHIFRYFFLPGKILDVLKFRPDVVYIEEEPQSLSALQAVLWAKFSGSKIVVKSCENMKRNIRFPFNIIEKLVLSQTNLLICLTKEVEGVFIEKGFGGKTVVVGLGVERFKMDGKSAENVRKKHSISKFAVGYFGRMMREKSIETIIEACASLDFDFQIVLDMHEDNTASFVDKPYKEELLDLARKRGVENRIIFVSPSYEEMGNYLSAIDVLVLPSKTTKGWKEQFGRVLIEAMNVGTPVIGSNSGSIPEIIGNAGLIFSEGNSMELSGKIKEIYKNRKIAGGLRKKGFERALEFSLDKIAGKTIGAFENAR